MKFFVVFIFMGLLLGCNHNDNPSQATDGDMSGTWRHTEVHEYHNTETDGYLSTEYIESTMVISEEDGDIQYATCPEYGKESHTGIKTDQTFVIDQGDRSFLQNSDGSYSTSEEAHIQYSWMTGTYFNRHFELEKISNDVVVDAGLLVLSGPIAVTEYNHVCLMKAHSNVYEDKILQLIVPYDDNELELSLGLLSTPEIGTISFTRFEQGSVIYSFNIISNASLFWETVGSNTLAIDSADINIIESNDSVLSGTFTFQTNSSENYSGEFSIDLRE